MLWVYFALVGCYVGAYLPSDLGQLLAQISWHFAVALGSFLCLTRCFLLLGFISYIIAIYYPEDGPILWTMYRDLRGLFRRG